MFSGTYLSSIIQIRSVTAEIFLTLSFYGGWVDNGGVGGGGGCKIIFDSNSTVTLRLRLGFDKMPLIWIIMVHIKLIDCG